MVSIKKIFKKAQKGLDFQFSNGMIRLSCAGPRVERLAQKKPQAPSQKV
jgi:hypothetical protein